MKYYAGIDGGGSKTLAVILDQNRQEVGRGIAGSSNNQVVGVESAAQNIAKAIEAATNSAGINLPLEKLIVGLAGVDRPADHALMLSALQKQKIAPPENILLDNDARLILYALPDAVGVGLIAGTGSIAFGCDRNGIKVRAGGWGYVFGDEGSGYDFGRRALQAAARCADGRGPSTLLLQSILNAWQLTVPSDLIGMVYQDGLPNNSMIAGLSRLVFEAAEANDEVALHLVEHAVNELATVVNAVATKLNLGVDVSHPLPLALSGGLLVNYEGLRQAVLNKLKTSFGLHLGTVAVVNEPAVTAAIGLIDLG